MAASGEIIAAIAPLVIALCQKSPPSTRVPGIPINKSPALQAWEFVQIPLISASVKLLVEKDRSTAIHTAILQASLGDGVIIAGKGHEDYQILGTEKIYFDDREQAKDALAKRLK